jgi:hypothetical protein
MCTMYHGYALSDRWLGHILIMTKSHGLVMLLQYAHLQAAAAPRPPPLFF